MWILRKSGLLQPSCCLNGDRRFLEFFWNRLGEIRENSDPRRATGRGKWKTGASWEDCKCWQVCVHPMSTGPLQWPWFNSGLQPFAASHPLYRYLSFLSVLSRFCVIKAKKENIFATLSCCQRPLLCKLSISQPATKLHCPKQSFYLAELESCWCTAASLC